MEAVETEVADDGRDVVDVVAVIEGEEQRESSAGVVVDSESKEEWRVMAAMLGSGTMESVCFSEDGAAELSNATGAVPKTVDTPLIVRWGETKLAVDGKGRDGQ